MFTEQFETEQVATASVVSGSTAEAQKEVGGTCLVPPTFDKDLGFYSAG